MLDPANIHFRPLQRADLPLLYSWHEAGFRHLKTVLIPFLNETYYLMRLARSEVR